MKKISDNYGHIKTVADNHEQLVGKTITIDGWEAVIRDTTQTKSGTIYIAVRVLAVPAMYLEKNWLNYSNIK